MTAAHNTNRRARHAALAFSLHTFTTVPEAARSDGAIVGSSKVAAALRCGPRDAQVIAIGQPFEPVAPLIGEGVNT
jgi:hypothetical protein